MDMSTRRTIANLSPADRELAIALGPRIGQLVAEGASPHAAIVTAARELRDGLVALAAAYKADPELRASLGGELHRRINAA